MRHALFLLACVALAAQAQVAWSGPGWYHVLRTAQGTTLQSGPHKTELACKKAMNSSDPREACVPLDRAPEAR